MGLLMMATKGWAWTFVQGSSSTEGNGGCGSNGSTTTVTAGDLLVAGCWSNAGQSGVTATDKLGNTWLVAKSTAIDSATSSNGTALTILYVANSLGGTNFETFNTGGCNSSNLCVVLEYSGQKTSSPFDVFSGSVPVATGIANITTLSTTSTSSNDLFVAFVDTATGGSFSAQNGTARTFSPQASNTVSSQDSIVGSPSPFTSTWTESSPFGWEAAQAAFKPSAGVSSGINNRSRIERMEE